MLNTTVVLVDIEISILLQPSLNTMHWYYLVGLAPVYGSSLFLGNGKNIAGPLGVGPQSLFSRWWALRKRACRKLVWLRHAGGNVRFHGSMLGQWYMHACFSATPTLAHVAMSLQPLGNAECGAREKYHREGTRTGAQHALWAPRCT